MPAVRCYIVFGSDLLIDRPVEHTCDLSIIQTMEIDANNCKGSWRYLVAFQIGMLLYRCEVDQSFVQPTPPSQISLGSLMVLHRVFLVLVATTPVIIHPASLAAGTLTVAGSGAATVASCYEHTRSVAPSSNLQPYFSAAILLDIARVRTLWLVRTSPVVLLSLILGFEVLTFSLESLRKTKFLTVDASTEEQSGLWERSLFSWLLSMLCRGYRGTLSLTCLPLIDSKLNSKT